MTTSPRIGLVDGYTEATSRRFHVLLDPTAVVQLDELVAVTSRLADGREVTHYGIVVETRGQLEGAEVSSDTARFEAQTLPCEREVRLMSSLDSAAPASRLASLRRRSRSAATRRSSRLATRAQIAASVQGTHSLDLWSAELRSTCCARSRSCG
ncbi:MAG: hypothetical protein ACRD0K_21090 [Egibacteraceae bacterium]